MIRMLFAMLLGVAAVVGLSLRLARDAATLPRSARGRRSPTRQRGGPSKRRSATSTTASATGSESF